MCVFGHISRDLRVFHFKKILKNSNFQNSKIIWTEGPYYMVVEKKCPENLAIELNKKLSRKLGQINKHSLKLRATMKCVQLCNIFYRLVIISGFMRVNAKYFYI